MLTQRKRDYHPALCVHSTLIRNNLIVVVVYLAGDDDVVVVSGSLSWRIIDGWQPIDL